MELFLGVDVGSVTTKFVLMDKNKRILASCYLRTSGDPIAALKEGLRYIERHMPEGGVIRGVGTTGSARHLAGVVIGADIVKNEITAHAVAAITKVPDVRTVFEIGGQDSKLIIIRNGVVEDFAMNTVCAAGTGSFLEHQAVRLNVPIEEFGKLALQAKQSVRIAGRCTVFAESDMIHKQQLGFGKAEIVKGLCEALVRNFMNNLAASREIEDPIVFQGGVAANQGMVQAFRDFFGGKKRIIVPEEHGVMGAWGAAILAMEYAPEKTAFQGFSVVERHFVSRSFTCTDCPNACEIVVLKEDDRVKALWGSRCGKWTPETATNHLEEEEATVPSFALPPECTTGRCAMHG
ncbi:acyl-CoA dehydratase activase [Candidatus Caldatribacterium sp.]|uniref:acyl-CoA dehydratase activase n=1 Tax=Candidatus Caldatribacterium sp. TaxID=2282143 RepID=UPI00299C4043|nr:acyl-CoA dehydratase activase [Candidatus Caldatribacterium sp.]MDW8081605.1 acyl-CoA dehydratase activase [Candidatus Calescibacterium sp.]